MNGINIAKLTNYQITYQLIQTQCTKNKEHGKAGETFLVQKTGKGDGGVMIKLENLLEN